MPALGLDIGSSSIKLIHLSGGATSLRLEAFGLGLNPVGTVTSDSEAELTRIAQAVKKLLSDVGVRERRAVVALPEAKVFTRVIEMPPLSDAELTSAIGWEAEQYIPVPLSEVQLDYQVLSRPKSSDPKEKMQVFLVAAPLRVIEKMAHLLELSGIEPVALETEILGLSRSLGRGNSGAILLVHLGLSSTDLCLLEGEQIFFTRAVPTGGNALSRTLVNELGLEFSQAESYKRTYGLDSKQLQGRVRKGLLPVFTSLIEEIRTAINFYASNRQRHVGRLVLSGGGAYLPEIASEFASNLGIEVVIGNPFNGIAISPEQQKRLGGIGAVFAVAVGLSLREGA